MLSDKYTVERPKNTRSVLQVFGPYRSKHSQGILCMERIINSRRNMKINFVVC